MPSVERQILMTLAGALLVLLVGVAGYMHIEGWHFDDALFMTVITVTTVGYHEVHPLSDAGRIFTIAVIFLGFGVVAYAVTRFTQFVIQGEMSRVFGVRRMKKMIERCDRHYIVCGYGRVGQTVCEELSDDGVPVIVSELNDELASQAEEDGFPVVRGNALSDEILEQAGIDRAVGLVSAVSGDGDNLLITLSARELNHDLYIVSRGEGRGIEQKLLRAGADVVIQPYRLTGQRIANLVLASRRAKDAPVTEDGVSYGGGTVAGYRLESLVHSVGENSTVGAMRERTGAKVVVAILRGDGSREETPPDDAVVRVEDRIVLLVEGKMAAHESGDSAGKKEKPDAGKTKRSVLIADDHPGLLRIYEKKLRVAGYETFTAAAGDEALEIIKREKPDIAVLDAMMPNMTGFDVCAAVREDPDVTTMKLVLFSASNIADLREKGTESGADAVLEKTGRSAELLETLEQLLSGDDD